MTTIHKSLVIICAVLLATSGVVLYVFFSQPTTHPQTPQKTLIISKRIAPFTLTSHTSGQFSEKNFAGKWSIVFFGYTHCPDICPITMQLLHQMVDQLATQDKKLAAKTQVLFISVDPKRDTPSHLHGYLDFFNPQFIGATGSTETIAAVVADMFAVYVKPDTSQKNYTVDHSGGLHLINPQGVMVAIIQPPFGDADNLLQHYLAVVAAS